MKFAESLFFLIAFSFSITAQTIPIETPELNQAGRSVKKVNQRPDSDSPKETFDGADAKSMAMQCVNLKTEKGEILLEFFPESAPETVRNFLNLTSLGAYDTTTFTRIVPEFVIQGGSASSRETKSDELYQRMRRKIPDEPSLIKHERGIVSMARGTEPNTASSSFFILIDEAPHLDGTFAAFGRVVSGMEVADSINKMSAVNEKPEKPVKIHSAIVINCAPKKEQSDL